MLGVQNNPFHKANPFRLIQFEKFQHAHLPGQKMQQHSHPFYKDHSRVLPARPLENNWTFKDNNLDKRVSFSRKPDLNNSRVSDFELSMKMSSIGAWNKQAPRAPYVQQSKLQNPFFRKNLLVNREEVMNLVELDVSLYRTKARSSYDSVPVTLSNIPQSKQFESPIVGRPRPSISEYLGNRASFGANNKDESSPSLGYSPTPQVTHRVSGRIPQQPQSDHEHQKVEHPGSINFKGKSFFLNS